MGEVMGPVQEKNRAHGSNRGHEQLLLDLEEGEAVDDGSGGEARDVTLRGGGLDGAALARAAAAASVVCYVVVVVVPVNVVVVGDSGGGVGEKGKVGFSFGAAEVAGGGVVGSGGFLGGVEGAEPDAGFLAGVADLGGVAAPGALSDAAVVNLVGSIVWLLILYDRFVLGDHGDAKLLIERVQKDRCWVRGRGWVFI
ncbi:uncharacterized protein HKW66_Vig0145990 [Vigna angularis]|uniref:Uncharacterized protein n=1 Tax=Phaseolus angularis TaxID=3914 RepID=A0A8T0KGA2_PHAAN|nr:uncharacterized protein HKW66_Vig0145990 [Vigna angularis]